MEIHLAEGEMMIIANGLLLSPSSSLSYYLSAFIAAEMNTEYGWFGG
jgi:hypothetical protein